MLVGLPVVVPQIAFGDAISIALLERDSRLCAVEIAPPKIPFVMLSVAKHLYAWNLEKFYLSVIASVR